MHDACREVLFADLFGSAWRLRGWQASFQSKITPTIQSAACKILQVTRLCVTHGGFACGSGNQTSSSLLAAKPMLSCNCNGCGCRPLTYLLLCSVCPSCNFACIVATLAVYLCALRRLESQDGPAEARARHGYLCCSCLSILARCKSERILTAPHCVSVFNK